MSCPGLHCPGCGGKEGGAAGLVLLVVIIYFRHQIIETLRAILTVVEIAGIVLGVVATLAVLCAITYAVLYVRARIQHRPAPRRPIPARVVRLGAEPEHAAISAPRTRPAWPHSGWEDIHTYSNRRNQ